MVRSFHHKGMEIGFMVFLISVLTACTAKPNNVQRLASLSNPVSSVRAGPAAAVLFTMQPSTSTDTDTVLGLQPIIEIYDSGGLLVEVSSNAITLKAYSDSGCNTEVVGGLSATTNPVSATSGVAAFSGVKILKTNVFRIGASGTGLVGACSTAIAVSHGAIDSISFFVQPAPTTNDTDTAFTTQPVIKAYDANSNIVTSDSASTVALTTYDTAACAGSTIASGLSGTTTKTLALGVATYTDIKAIKTSAKSIKATLGAKTACSSTLTVNPGAVASLTFDTQPSSAATLVTSALSQAPIIKAWDANSNLATNALGNITLSAYSSSNCSGAVLSGVVTATTNPVSLASGVATFANMIIANNTAIRLGVTDGTLSTCSNAISIVEPAGFLATYTFISANQTFTVPAGFFSVSIKAWGAGGGGGGGVNGTNYSGGGGGYATGTFAVTPGQSYTVVVGGGGGTSSNGVATGGFGGGGSGNASGGWGSGGGGGRSALVLSGTELITAGGGGGGSTSLLVNRAGGGGGGLIGIAGSSDSVSGSGGTQSAGGAAGLGAIGNGSAGSQFTGGAGNATYGAGGGGGYFGGGGGGVSPGDVASGGGGSSYISGAGLSGASTTAASGATPGNSTDSLRNGAGTGGAGAAVGSNGLVVIYNGSVGVNSISPSQGILAGGGTLQVYGFGFASGTTVTVGGNNCSNVIIASEFQLSCNVPASISAQVVDVSVTVPGYAASTLSSSYFYYNSITTLSYTGANQAFIVPGGVTSISIGMWGAGGGGSTGVNGANYSGGGGGYASGILSVTPGQSYTVVVGGGGGTSSSGVATGGFGGGGSGNALGGWGSGGGGGRSALVLSGTELITAGGGGGGATSAVKNRVGGGGGGAIGAAGSSDVVSGFGGTQSAGGVGGVGAIGNGSAGSQFTGGAGNATYGAGGGGGYYGGGGGGVSPGDIASGGGGSSYISGAGLSGASTTAASGDMPGNSTDSLRNGAGTGGAGAAVGSNGSVTIFY